MYLCIKFGKLVYQKTRNITLHVCVAERNMAKPRPTLIEIEQTKDMFLSAKRLIWLDQVGYEPHVYTHGVQNCVRDALIKVGVIHEVDFLNKNNFEYPAPGCSKTFLRQIKVPYDRNKLTCGDAYKLLKKHSCGITYWQMKKLYMVFGIPCKLWMKKNMVEADQMIERLETQKARKELLLRLQLPQKKSRK